MNNFLFDFASNLLATIIGVVIGIPLALWVNRKNNHENYRRIETQNNLKYLDSLTLINTNVAEDFIVIQKLAADTDHKLLILSMELNPSIWTAVKKDIIEFEQDVVLKKEIANYYFKLKRLNYFKKMYEDFTVGANADVSGAWSYRNIYNKTMSKLATEMLEDSTRLTKKIQAKFK